jgi:hypothetical protein
MYHRLPAPSKVERWRHPAQGWRVAAAGIGAFGLITHFAPAPIRPPAVNQP